jgi:hypothetical protein
VEELLQNADIWQLLINAAGLTDVSLGSFTYNISLDDLDILNAWNTLQGTTGYEKITTNLPNDATIRPEGANVRIQDKTAFMQRLEWVSDFTHLAQQLASAYFATNSISDTNFSSYFVPDTINMTGNLKNLDVVERVLMDIPNKQYILNIPQNGARYDLSRQTLDNIVLAQSYLSGLYNCYGDGDLPPQANQSTRKFKAPNHFSINNLDGNSIIYGYELNAIVAGLGGFNFGFYANSTNRIHFNSNTVTLSLPNPLPSDAIHNGKIAINFDRLCYVPLNLTGDFSINFVANFGSDSIYLVVQQPMIDAFGANVADYIGMLLEYGISITTPIAGIISQEQTKSF